MRFFRCVRYGLDVQMWDIRHLGSFVDLYSTVATKVAGCLFVSTSTAFAVPTVENVLTANVVTDITALNIFSVSQNLLLDFLIFIRKMEHRNKSTSHFPFLQVKLMQNANLIVVNLYGITYFFVVRSLIDLPSSLGYFFLTENTTSFKVELH